MLPDEKILNGKKLQKQLQNCPKQFYKEPDQTLNIWKWCVSNGNRTRNLLRRGRVFCTKGYLNGRS